jgi:hypothetical protein
MKQRRNPFGEIPADPATQPPALSAGLRLAEKRTRSRHWEKENLSWKAMYRGVDPALALQVKQIAGDLQVPTGEVARALLEYGLRALGSGELELLPQPNLPGMRMTLYPQEQRTTKRRSPVSRKRAGEEKGWRVIVTWRGIPPGLKQEIASLASAEGLNVPTGELVTALLRYSLRAYEYRLLRLEPVEKVSTYTLFAGEK